MKEIVFKKREYVRLPDGSRIALEDLSPEEYQEWRSRMVAKAVEIIFKDQLEADMA